MRQILQNMNLIMNTNFFRDKIKIILIFENKYILNIIELISFDRIYKVYNKKNNL